MKDWNEFDDYMIYNEKEKRAITWTTYGDDVKYFLSVEFSYKDDIFEECNDRHTLINVEINGDATLESLIERTKEMI